MVISALSFECSLPIEHRAEWWLLCACVASSGKCFSPPSVLWTRKSGIMLCHQLFKQPLHLLPPFIHCSDVCLLCSRRNIGTLFIRVYIIIACALHYTITPQGALTLDQLFKLAVGVKSHLLSSSDNVPNTAYFTYSQLVCEVKFKVHQCADVMDIHFRQFLFSFVLPTAHFHCKVVDYIGSTAALHSGATLFCARTGVTW